MSASQYITSNSYDFDNIDEQGDFIRRNVILLNSDVIPDAPYFTLTWYLKPTGNMQTTHTHDFDEHVGFVGSDPDDPTKLNGVIKFMIDDEWVTMTESTVLFIPAGVKHCPYIIEQVDKPILHWSACSAGAYSQNK